MQIQPEESRKRKREKWAVLILALLLILLVTIELFVSRWNKVVPFGQSVILFSLINVNLIIFLVLIFFAFRNVAKIFLERAKLGHGVSLRKKLVLAFTLFATVPTILLSATSAYYVYQSFEKWFSARIIGSFQQSLQVTEAYYLEAQSRSDHMANRLIEKIENDPSIISTSEALQAEVKKFVNEVDVDWAEVQVGMPPMKVNAWNDEIKGESVNPLTEEEITEAKEKGKSQLTAFIAEGELSRVSKVSENLKTLVVSVGNVIPKMVSEKTGTIHMNLEDYRMLLPVQKAVKATFLFTLIGMVLLILFFSSWLGFYISRRLIKPLEDLTEASHRLSEGVWTPIENSMESVKEYEVLVRSFNEMGQNIQTAKQSLEMTNRELEHDKLFLEVLVKSVSFGVLALDELGNYQLSNAALSKVLGIQSIPRDRLEMQSLFSRLLPEFSQFLCQWIDRPGESMEIEESIHDIESKSSTLLKISGIPLRTRAQEITGIVYIFEDLTEIQSIQRSLAWKEVARRLAHEFKNPLTPIRLSAERIQRNLQDMEQEKLEAATRSIILSVNQLTQLVDTFSQYSKLPEVQVELADIGALIQDTVEIYKQAHPNIEFRLHHDSKIPPFLLDTKQLGRALSNLIKNAVQVLSEKEDEGLIEVVTSLRPRLGLVSLQISDNGPGLNEHVAKRVFEPYFSTKTKGTGLGLAIVQKIVQDHQGVVRVQPNVPHGTRFVIDLPIRGALKRESRVEVVEMDVT